MRNDIPAALPLIALVLGLASAPSLVDPQLFAWGLLAVAVLIALAGADCVRPRVRAATALLFAALGIYLSLGVAQRHQRETAVFTSIDESRFTTIDAPLDRDWSPRGSSFVLRTRGFTANGRRFDAALRIYARFPPPPMQLESHVRAEGFLRRNERGDYSLTLKSPRLMSYHGELRGPARWNRLLANRLRPHAEKHPTEVALVEALALGRGERLTDEVRDSFRRGGTYHLLVFSGLQIALAAALLAMLLRWIGAPRASDWLLLTFAITAPLFIGPTASVARAATGLGLYALSRIAKRPTSLQNLWCVAALLRLVIEPRDLTDVAFHLTYAGAGALLFVARGRRWLAHVVAAELAMTPLTLFHFHRFALGGSLVTLAMAPLIFAMLVVSALACAVPCDALFTLIAALHRLCGVMNGFAFSGFFTAPPLPAMACGFGLALLALLLDVRWRPHAIALALSIPLVTAAVLFHDRRAVDTPAVTFLDVDQGDAIVVRTGTRTLLVDGGGRNEDLRFGETQLLPLLVDRGIRRIDVVALTHAHPDHCGGLPAVLEQLDVGELWISPRRFRGDCATRLLEAARTSRTPIRLVRDGESRSLGDLRITAHVADRTFRRAPENNASLLLHLRAGVRTILLTGDIEREAEIYFSDRQLRSDVLKVAHHGSRSSTLDLFLDTVRPRVAVVSCGRRNLFGHPHPDVVARLGERGARLLRTDRDGTVELRLRDRHLFAIRERQP